VNPLSLRLRFVLPLGVFLVTAAFLYVGLSLDPGEIPSPLISERVPEFSLPPLEGRERGLGSEDLLTGEVSLVNVFASWCGPCRAEHPLLMRLSAEGIVPVYGINYKDRPADAIGWLAELGDPFTLIGADRDGRVSIDWGVYGIPETFVVDRQGRIAYKHIGPIMPQDLNEKILPLVESLK
jgi:cytochrome c biogenesis protein CcmG/thiol:disulfide interchange protein DsbE